MAVEITLNNRQKLHIWHKILAIPLEEYSRINDRFKEKSSLFSSRKKYQRYTTTIASA
jgi:hypothetical protein